VEQMSERLYPWLDRKWVSHHHGYCGELVAAAWGSTIIPPGIQLGSGAPLGYVRPMSAGLLITDNPSCSGKRRDGPALTVVEPWSQSLLRVFSVLVSRSSDDGHLDEEDCVVLVEVLWCY
jgi:hypothetical protein